MKDGIFYTKLRRKGVHGGNMILIDFYDSDVISTLMPAYTLKPEKIYMLYDSARCTDRQLSNVKKALLGRLKKTTIATVECDSYSVASVQSAVNLIMAQNPSAQFAMDIKGGPDLMVASGMNFAREKGVQIFYLSEDDKYLYDVYNPSEKFYTEKIKISDYLVAEGAKQYANSHEMPEKDEFYAITKMCETIFDNMNAWSKYQKFMEEAVAGEGRYDFTFDSRRFPRNISGSIETLNDAFEKYGFITQIARHYYKINSHKAKQYMTTYGIWLELYVYINALKCYNDVYLGFIIDWDSSLTEDTNDNEIDVIVMENSRPVFISCKTRKPDAKDLCEVGFLAKRLGGERAKSVLATTYPVRETGDTKNSIYSRMKKFDIGLIEARDFRKRETEVVFNNAFKPKFD